MGTLSRQLNSYSARPVTTLQSRQAPFASGDTRLTFNDVFSSEAEKILTIVCELCLTVALLVAGHVFYEVNYSNVVAHKAQQRVSRQLDTQWRGSSQPAADPNAVSEGTPVGKMYIPMFGVDWMYPVVSGTSDMSLLAGVGFYRGSQNFGERGNTAVAGHRDGQGAVFHDLDRLDTCDAIVVETSDAWYVYRVLPISDYSPETSLVETMEGCMGYKQAALLAHPMYHSTPGRVITVPTDVDVVAPVPSKNAIAAHDAATSLITLTTCHPVRSNEQRLIIHAALAQTYNKDDMSADFRPSALSETMIAT